MSRSLYVYYRIDAAGLADAVAAARAMQAVLRDAHPTLHTQLMRRPDEQEGQVTVMETYAMPGGIDDELRAHIGLGAAALAGLVRSARHVEVFEPLG
jgi:hypothetical protein